MQSATIVAIATAIVPQQGSVGIVRMSGESALSIARMVFDAPGSQAWESHRILYGYVRHPKTKTVIDEALLMIMLAPRSYTREDVIEIHCHGGIMAVQQVLQVCVESGANLAQPGEFTLRAFLNGRIDLTQAESIADLVGSKSAQAATTALAGIQGKLAQPIRELRGIALDILAEVEARIDFADDLPPLYDDRIVSSIDAVIKQVTQILATADRGELLRSGLKVAIVGRPNVGKSSLLNAWSQSDRAIVTDLPGTTRDVVESQLVVGGIPVQVLDTAGIRDTEDVVERIGVERSRAVAQSADLVLFTLAADQGWTDGDTAIYDQIRDRPHIFVINKIDIATPIALIQTITTHASNISNVGCVKPSNASSPAPPSPAPPFTASPQIVQTIAPKNIGIPDLENAILQQIHQHKTQATNLDLAINQRQSAALTRAKIALEQVKETIQNQLPLDFWTIDLRGATQALSEILGEDVTESMLDRIFSRFCIGK